MGLLRENVRNQENESHKQEVSSTEENETKDGSQSIKKIKDTFNKDVTLIMNEQLSAQELIKETNLTEVNVKAEKIKEGKENNKLTESNSVKANILNGEKEETNSRKSAVEYPPKPALNHQVTEKRRANTRTIEKESSNKKYISDNKQMAEANKPKQASYETNFKSDTKKEITIQRRENPSQSTETFDKEITKNMKVKRRESSTYEDLQKSDVKGGQRESGSKKDDLPPNVILWVLLLTAALIGFLVLSMKFRDKNPTQSVIDGKAKDISESSYEYFDIRKWP